MLRITLVACITLSLVMPAPARAPDIILLMADDMGFSDLGCYGSEIPTPHLDRLASHGVRFTQFHNTSRCCPSRASLMTGLYSHQAGVGKMNNVDRGPGYRGQLLAETPTIAEMLRTVGYNSAMVGKWHLTLSKTIDDGPNGSWPLQRGFEQYYGTMEGAKNYFRPKWLFDGARKVTQFADDFFYTDAIAQRAAQYILDQPADKPLLSYVAFYAPHFPLQAPAETIAKFRGKYAAGWDVIRAARLARQKSIGIVPASTVLSPRTESVPTWNRLDAQQRDQLDLRMAIYAAQVHRLDEGVGRIVDALTKTGRLEDTLLIFLSDNGGAGTGGPMGSGRVELLGGPGAELVSTYGSGWANVSNTPFRQYKANTHEGGTRAPLIMHWPRRLGTETRFVRSPTHIIDIAATCVDAAGARRQRVRRKFTTRLLEGTSLLDCLDERSADSSRTFAFEHESSRALRSGKWKLVNRDNEDAWELYDLESDSTELHDLSEEMPEQTRELAKQWNVWARRCNVTRSNQSKRQRIETTVGMPVGALPGVVVDDINAIKYGRWQEGNRLDGYVGTGYLYTSDPNAVIEYLIPLPEDRTYELRLLYAAHENRGHSVPVTVTQGIESTKRLVNMQRSATAGSYKSLGRVNAQKGQTVQVRIAAERAGGVVHADAIQLIEAD